LAAGGRSILGLLLIAVMVRSAMSLVEGNGTGLLWLLLDTLVWSAMTALVVQWRTPEAREVRDRWIFPGLLASAGLIAIGLLTHLYDFLIDGVTLTMPVLATACMLMRNSSSVTE
jgi:hypothetical protein